MQLVISEKPSVANSIAQVLGATDRKNGYMEGNGYIVSWCVGHLVELAQPDAYGEQYGKWIYDSLPIIPDTWKHMVKEDTKDQYHVLYQLMHDDRVDTIVCATDAGREGELIFRLVYKMAACNKPFFRLWISSMEENAIKEGFEHLRPGSEYDHLFMSALGRQQADWLVGINGTRLFTVLYGGKVLKVGRVQTPTLAMLVDREASIMNFVKEKYYMTHLLMNGMDVATKRINDKAQAESIMNTCKGKQARISKVVKEEKAVAPPKLYDLTTLQRDANRLYGFTAKQTLEYTQTLYEKKLVTYPRTDSQFLTDDMEDNAASVIVAIQNKLQFAQNFMLAPDIQRVMNSKKVSDHHAIIPTVELLKADLSALPTSESKILSLVGNRLLCATGSKHLYEKTSVEVECEGNTFSASGKVIKDFGWKEIDTTFRNSLSIKEEKEADSEDKSLPDIAEGMTFDNVDSKVSEHDTTPPKHYTEDSLLSAMERAGAEDMGDEVERKGLGTPATRADIIEKLVKDGFVKRDKKQMIPTDDGMKLITVLPEIVKSPKLTADWENDLTLVAKGELNLSTYMNGIQVMVQELVTTYHEVSEDNKKMFSSNQKPLGKCPKCGGDILKGKYGPYCSKKCGMNVSRAMGATLSDDELTTLLAGKKLLMKGLRGKSGKVYDAYLIPEGIEDYSYMKDGKEVRGSQFRFKMEFPKRKSSKKQ